jgi:8-oxo-dGTP pyrophosphatase MutT (NUDIX family)
MQVIPTCGTVIFNKVGEVLLVEHLSGASHLTGSFGLPAGKIDQDENALDAAVRETFEETGLIVPKEAFHKLPTVYQAKIEQKDGYKTFSWDVFTTQVVGGRLLESSETRPQWIKIEDVASLTLLPNVLNAINEAKMVLKI